MGLDSKLFVATKKENKKSIHLHLIWFGKIWKTKIRNLFEFLIINKLKNPTCLSRVLIVYLGSLFFK